MKAHLPRTSSVLRRLLRGEANLWTRTRIRQTAEQQAAKNGATPDAVLEAIRRKHGARLNGPEYDELRMALEIDLPVEPVGGAA